jgi:hypothetical protein
MRTIHLQLLLAAGIPALASQVEMPTSKRSALVRIEGHVDLQRTPAQVWSALVSPKGLAALTGVQLPDSAQGIAKVGDSTTASVWSDKGTLVCTQAVEAKELRISFEPENASYVCADRILLEPARGGGTRLAITDRYSDDHMDTVDKTSKEVAAEMSRHLSAFQAVAERP